MNYSKLAEKLFFSKEAAEFLGITVQRLNQLVHEGKIRPLKKNSSGTVFHIHELELRKEEMLIFNEVKEGGKNGMFEINTRTKQEALNFATMMNALAYTENKLEPLFEILSQKVDIAEPLVQENICNAYAEFFNVETERIKKEYQVAYKAFSQLRPTDEIIKRGNKDYPPLLMKTEQAPRFLYIRGKKSLLFEKRTVALVGSRNASEVAKENTRRVAEALGRNGIIVVSGLAKGIDVTAHVTALRNSYNTIAVIGTNLNQYYPKENREVQKEIERKGVVVSQFSPANKTQRWFFPLRNGVMSGLSLATVIMEAGETSGALKQADFALKQNRLILIPEKALEMTTITWPARYVKRGAEVVRNPKDIISKLSESSIYNQQEKEEFVQSNLEDFFQKQESTAEKESTNIRLNTVELEA